MDPPPDTQRDATPPPHTLLTPLATSSRLGSPRVPFYPVGLSHQGPRFPWKTGDNGERGPGSTGKERKILAPDGALEDRVGGLVTESDGHMSFRAAGGEGTQVGKVPGIGEKSNM